MRAQFNILSTTLFSLLIVLAFSIGTANAQVARNQEVVSLRDGLKEMLQNQGAQNLKKLSVNVDAEKAAEIKANHQVEISGSFTVYQGVDADGNVIGSVVQIHEQGKEGPLQLLVAFREDGEIYDVGFTLFGEDKGKPALSWNYLKQYIGKSPADPLTVGKDLDGISGATWTTTSVSGAVKRAAVIYAEFFS